VEDAQMPDKPAVGDQYKDQGNKRDAVPPAPPPDLDKQLKEQRDAVDAAQTKVTKDAKDLADAQNGLRDLQNRVDALQRAISAYDKTLQQRLDDEESALTEKLDIANAVLKDTKKVDDAIKGVQDGIDAKQAAVNSAEKDLSAANEEVDGKGKAADSLRSAQSDLDDAKKLPKTIDAALQTVKSLLDQINKAESQNDFAAVYFLVKEAQNITGALHGKIPTADQYSLDIRTKEAAVKSAQDDLNKKKSNAATALDTYNQRGQDYEAANKKRQADILNAIKAIPHKAAA
jgi:chromosome segregation ATPase